MASISFPLLSEIKKSAQRWDFCPSFLFALYFTLFNIYFHYKTTLFPPPSADKVGNHRIKPQDRLWYKTYIFYNYGKNILGFQERKAVQPARQYQDAPARNSML